MENTFNPNGQGVFLLGQIILDYSPNQNQNQADGSDKDNNTGGVGEASPSGQNPTKGFNPGANEFYPSNLGPPKVYIQGPTHYQITARNPPIATNLPFFPIPVHPMGRVGLYPAPCPDHQHYHHSRPQQPTDNNMNLPFMMQGQGALNQNGNLQLLSQGNSQFGPNFNYNSSSGPIIDINHMPAPGSYPHPHTQGDQSFPNPHPPNSRWTTFPVDHNVNVESGHGQQQLGNYISSQSFCPSEGNSHGNGNNNYQGFENFLTTNTSSCDLHERQQDTFYSYQGPSEGFNVNNSRPYGIYRECEYDEEVVHDPGVEVSTYRADQQCRLDRGLNVEPGIGIAAEADGFNSHTLQYVLSSPTTNSPEDGVGDHIRDCFEKSKLLQRNFIDIQSSGMRSDLEYISELSRGQEMFDDIPGSPDGNVNLNPFATEFYPVTLNNSTSTSTDYENENKPLFIQNGESGDCDPCPANGENVKKDKMDSGF